ncbi:unnamed protein product [Urochloa humidicola]
MDGNGGPPYDFFSQSASSGAAVHPIDDDGWGLTPPRLRGSAGRGSMAGLLGRGSMVGGLGRGEVAGGLDVHRMGLENMELNADSAAAASYPNMSMYTHLLHPGSASGHGMPLQRTRSDIVPQRQGRPPRQGLPPLRAPNRRGKQVVATSGRGGAGSSRSGSGRQQQAPSIMVDDVEEEYEEEEDDSMLNQHMQVQISNV